MMKWEYMAVGLTQHSVEHNLNQLGNNGWELVAIGGQWGNVAYLKRPLLQVTPAREVQIGSDDDRDLPW